MHSFMIVCPNCGAVGSATNEEPKTAQGAGWDPFALRLSKEFHRRINARGGLEMVCDACRTVVEFHGTATWLKRASTTIDLHR